MALSYKSKRRWSVVILIIGLPAYLIVAVNIVALFDRPPVLVEFAVYVGLGIVWILPFKRVFQGIGQPDPDTQNLGAQKPDKPTPDKQESDTRS